MKLFFLVSTLLMFMSHTAMALTWEQCRFETLDGETKIAMNSLIHEQFAREYVIDYSISGQYHEKNRIGVMVTRSNNSIHYLNTAKNFSLLIECTTQGCFSTLQTMNVELVNLKTSCDFNIKYTPETGSGGRCGGRRC